mgnify:CR=1 FL=1|tara:strand:+ start:4010 stop:4312 length:303 start_codon:yes stop_codon:yes gene_type:complete
MRVRAELVLLLSAFALTGCTDSIAGTYTDPAGVAKYAFSANGNVRIFVLGAEVDAEYRLDDDKVLISSAQGTVVLTRRDDRLYGPMGLELVREKTDPQGD